MARTRTSYLCRACGYRSPKWLGRCPSCGEWETLEARGDTPPKSNSRARPYPSLERSESRRRTTGIDEFDRVLGGGLVPGAVVLLGGEPGVGKSTLLLQCASRLAESGRPILYASGEESGSQLRSRGDRLGVESEALLVVASTDVDAILAAAEDCRPDALIVDSIQAVRGATDAASGSVSQVRECAARFVEFAKRSNVPVMLVGHVTKDGALAGPRALEHVVDTVLQFEGDRHHEHRILRAIKNRFGATNEIAVFRMLGSGLEAVASPSELFLSERTEGVAGSVVLAAVEGSRPILVEVQALVGPPVRGSARRTSVGVDPNRLALILAVLETRALSGLAERDVFVNVTGGLQLSEPAADLAVAAAVASSAMTRPLPGGTVVAGEIGLTGEIRRISRLDRRLLEAARLGFRQAFVPAGEPGESPLTVVRVARIDELLTRLFPGPPPSQIG